jgi:NADH-quinone oxidoreductase subunit F
MEPLMGALKHFCGEFEAKVVNAAAQVSSVEQA